MSELKIHTPNPHKVHLNSDIDLLKYNFESPEAVLNFPKTESTIEKLNLNLVLDVDKIASTKFNFVEAPEADLLNKDLFEDTANHGELLDSLTLSGNNTDLKATMIEDASDEVAKKSLIIPIFIRLVDKFVNLENIIFVLLVALAIAFRNIFVPFLSGDVTNFLTPWMEHIVQNGGFVAFKEKFFDYSPSYVYLLWAGTVVNFNPTLWVKGISIFFDFVAAGTIAKIVHIKNPGLWKYAFLTTLMFPSVLFNSSMWGQCDVIYSSFCLISLFYILTKKHLQSYFFFAIAISFKFQSIFFAPVFWFLFLFKNLKARALVLLGVLTTFVYGVSVLPAYLTGRPLLDTAGQNNGLLTIYLNQGKVYGGLVMGSIPNLYQWIDNSKYEYFYPAGVILTLFILGILSLIFVKQKTSQLSNDNIVRLSLLTTLIIPYFLPKMHDRYMFMAELMSLVYVFWFPKRFWIGLVMGLISYSIYIRHIIGGSVPMFLEPIYNSITILAIMAFLLFEILRDIKSKNQIN